jgi:carotenoid cleavage dioxygenase
MHFGLADAQGRVQKRVDVPLPGPRLPHDLALTENFAILMDLPIVFDEEALAKGRWRTSFNRELPARFALVPRAVGDDKLRWFEASPCYMYHSVNAWEEDGAVVLVGCRVPEPYQPPRPEEGPYAVMMATLRIRAELYMWRFDLKTGACTETKLCDRNTEFPSMDRRRIGRKSQFSWNVIIGDEPTVFFDGLVKYDTGTGASNTLRFGPGQRGSESPFAPRVGSKAEDDGYLLTFLHDERAQRSELWIIPAQEPSLGPVARLHIPGRVPLGFHATFVAGDKLASGSALNERTSS